jgi:hypothetical protein
MRAGKSAISLFVVCLSVGLVGGSAGAAANLLLNPYFDEGWGDDGGYQYSVVDHWNGQVSGCAVFDYEAPLGPCGVYGAEGSIVQKFELPGSGYYQIGVFLDTYLSTHAHQTGGASISIVFGAGVSTQTQTIAFDRAAFQAAFAVDHASMLHPSSGKTLGIEWNSIFLPGYPFDYYNMTHWLEGTIFNPFGAIEATLTIDSYASYAKYAYVTGPLQIIEPPTVALLLVGLGALALAASGRTRGDCKAPGSA